MLFHFPVELKFGIYGASRFTGNLISFHVYMCVSVESSIECTAWISMDGTHMFYWTQKFNGTWSSISIATKNVDAVFFAFWLWDRVLRARALLNRKVEKPILSFFHSFFRLYLDLTAFVSYKFYSRHSSLSQKFIEKPHGSIPIDTQDARQ